MGLASKLAQPADQQHAPDTGYQQPGWQPGQQAVSQSADPPAYGAPQPGQQPYGAYAQGQSGFPGYAAPQPQPGYGYPQPPNLNQQQPGYGYPQQPGYSYPQQAPASQYPAPFPHGPTQALPGVDAASIKRRLETIVAQNSLHAFYPEQRLRALAAEVAQKDLAGLARRWRLQPNSVLELCALALYDTVIMADDSGSMAAAEGGERIEDLKAMLSRIADAAALFDTDGISVRFMNGQMAGNNLRSADEIKAFVAQAKFGGLTPLGTMLQHKILQPFVLGPAKSRSLKKPVLVITITDGEPTGESHDAIRHAVKDAKKALHHSGYGHGAVAFQFVQVGRDQEAHRFLGKLDNDPKVGGMIDATSYIELEQEECRKRGIDLTVDLYMVKLLVGAIDSSHDLLNESKRKKKGLLASLFA